MAALTITVAEVLPGAGANIDGSRVAGESITQGQSVYLAAAGTWMKAQCDGTAIENGSLGLGIALCPALTNQPIQVQLAGIITVGASAAPVVGTVYSVGRAYGSIVPHADLASTDRVAILGVASSTSAIDMVIKRYTSYTV